MAILVKPPIIDKLIGMSNGRSLTRQSKSFSIIVSRCLSGSSHSLTERDKSSSSDFNGSDQPSTLNVNSPYTLCFVRHGQSTWNRDNRFIGWTDTPLTDDGVHEARVAGQMLARSGILFDEVHTSLLRRSIRTANILLMELQQEYIPVYKHWRLNERHYGDLVGLNKKEMVALHGASQVKRWRRSFDEPPPPMSYNHQHHPRHDPRYHAILDQIPTTESLKCTVERSSVYWNERILPSLRAGKTVLVVGHENNLRSILMKLEDISEKDIINLSMPRAVPLAYRLDPVTLKPLDRLDGKLDEATGFLRGEWLGGDDAVSEILKRDEKQVYDTKIKENLELVGKDNASKWNTWMEFVLGSKQKDDRKYRLPKSLSSSHEDSQQPKAKAESPKSPKETSTVVKSSSQYGRPNEQSKVNIGWNPILSNSSNNHDKNRNKDQLPLNGSSSVTIGKKITSASGQ